MTGASMLLDITVFTSIFSRLEYPGLEKESFERDLISDKVTIDFANFINWISVQLQKFCGIEECVNSINGMKCV